MLIALFAISTSTSLLNKILTEEERRQINVAKEYLESYNYDIKNITNDPRIQIIVEAKKALKQINEELLSQKEQRKINLKNYLANAKNERSWYATQEGYERTLLEGQEEFDKHVKTAIERADRKSNEVFLEAYKRLF